MWVFGDGTGSGRVISESRDLTTLGETIMSEDGRAVLEETGDLIEAYESSEGPRRRLTRRLNSAQNTLRAAAEDFDPELVDDEIRHLLGEIRTALDQLTPDLDDT